MSNPARSTIQKRDHKGVVRHGGEWLAIWSDPESLKSAAEKQTDQAAQKAVSDFRAQLAASARSVSANQDLEVVFGAGTDRDGRIFLEPVGTVDNAPAIRGACDAKAGFERYHEADPEPAAEDPDIARMAALMERVRCQALAARAFVGIQANLAAAHLERMRRQDLLNAHLASLIPLSHALEMVLRDSLLDASDPSIQTGGMRMWDRWLRDRFQENFIALAQVADNQALFAQESLGFIDQLFETLPSKGRHTRRLAKSPAECLDPDDPDETRLRETDRPEDIQMQEPGDILFGPDDTPPPGILTANPQPTPEPYHAYTTRFDRIVNAVDIADQASLRHARLALDEKRAAFRQSFGKLVSRLQRRLMAKQLRSWEFDLEEGLIDASRLDRIVLNPGFSHAYKRETDSLFRDTVVTLLIDNSGSMRGKPIEIACLVSDMLAAALERCSIRTEILGFTTSEWKGGKSAMDWAKAGQPDAPGRLNDLLHVVFKAADTPLRRARDGICAMLSPALLKENIDGEALQWAAHRLLSRPERRKILVLISDGAPVDQKTLDANGDKQILDRHLREMIRWLENETPIELSAIGIKHDVSDAFSNACRIDRIEDLGPVLVQNLEDVFRKT